MVAPPVAELLPPAALVVALPVDPPVAFAPPGAIELLWVVVPPAVTVTVVPPDPLLAVVTPPFPKFVDAVVP